MRLISLVTRFCNFWVIEYSCNLANKAKACNDESALFHDLLDCARALADIRQHEVPAVLCNYPQQS
jgi:hypothetical protein